MSPDDKEKWLQFMRAHLLKLRSERWAAVAKLVRDGPVFFPEGVPTIDLTQFNSRCVTPEPSSAASSIFEKMASRAADEVSIVLTGREVITSAACSHVDIFEHLDGTDHAALMDLGIICEPDGTTSATSS